MSTTLPIVLDLSHTALSTLSATLAQGAFGGLSIPSPQPLPSAPVWERFILEQPWPAVAILGLAAIVVFLKARGRARGIAPALLLLVAVGVYAASEMVTTANEHIRASTRRLVAAVVGMNVNAVGTELDSSARLFSHWHNSGVGKDDILAEVESRFRTGGEYAIKEHDTIELSSSRDGTRVGRSLVKVRAISAMGNVPVFSWWLLDYRRTDDGRWLVVQMEPQSISFVSDSRAKR